MNRRTRRAVIGAATLVAALVTVLVAANRGTVRDHLEVWCFQLTRKTKTIDPIPRGFGLRAYQYSTEERLLHVAADQIGCPVLFDPQRMAPLKPVSFTGDYRELLEQRGYRVLEQRFPRRAYVLIRDADSTEQTAEKLGARIVEYGMVPPSGSREVRIPLRFVPGTKRP